MVPLRDEWDSQPSARKGRSMPRYTRFTRLLASTAMLSVLLGGCAGGGGGAQLPPASFVALQEGPGEEYVIGPLDDLTIFVWQIGRAHV